MSARCVFEATLSMKSLSPLLLHVLSMYATKSHIHIGHHTSTSTEMQTQQILCSYSGLHKNFGLSAKSHASAVSLMAHSVLFSSIKPHHDSQALSLLSDNTLLLQTADGAAHSGGSSSGCLPSTSSNGLKRFG